jgi:hypothetical protein
MVRLPAPVGDGPAWDPRREAGPADSTRARRDRRGRRLVAALLRIDCRIAIRFAAGVCPGPAPKRPLTAAAKIAISDGDRESLQGRDRLEGVVVGDRLRQ